RWGRGLASELTAALITHARCAGVRALVLECAAEQTVTQHIAERFGFYRLADAPLVLYELRLN
ncbi:MAG: GNAT family N-acetyltransferase, partial [Oscillospiraceae bacterium]|nr:GNAT family N-acetyltransferase [Oscillospiraceae bacterium]